TLQAVPFGLLLPPGPKGQKNQGFWRRKSCFFFRLGFAAGGLFRTALTSEDWVRLHVGPPVSEHKVRCVFGLTSADLVASLRPDPLRPWEKAPPPLEATGLPLARLRPG
ncbi:unnamed protein product, partial [Polarella glacialis]